MTDYGRETDKELEEVLSAHKTRITIVGAGGGGNNTVTRLLEVGIKGVEVLAVNTDAQDLLYAKANKKLLIGRNITNGLGAGSDPKLGEEAARENQQDIETALAGSDMVFVTCGLGGGTGTGSAPIIAELAKKNGALTIAVVTLPFSDEGIIRWENARKGLAQLQEKVDTVIVVQNDRLLDLVPDMPLSQAFKVADEILVNAVKGITELVTEKGLVNLDFADVRTIMENGGIAMIGLGECETNDTAEEAARKALENPLLDVDVTGAQNALINITGGKEMSLKSAKTIMKVVAKRLDPAAKIIWGSRLDETMGQGIRVMLIVTRLRASRRTASDVEMVLKQPAQLSDSHAETEPTEPEPKARGQGNKVFSEIFTEESESDITLFEEASRSLKVGRRAQNIKQLKKIKNACTSLYNSSELFAFNRISAFTELVGEVTERGLKEEFDLSESLIEIYQSIPTVLQGMVRGEEEAYKAADEIKEKLSKILELLEPNGSAEAEGQNDDKGGGEPAASEGTTKTEGRPTDKGNGSPSFSDVKEAVRFIDKLF